MSVIEPETDARGSEENSVMHSDINDANGGPVNDNDDDQKQPLEELRERASASKKRKSHKTKDGEHKKAKKPAYINASAISLQT